ncbi:MAG: InlB B-repeat-containing protein [Clostridia bacterium]|nr:InlB B-repeat-containing protein [Clostridia bacterium]
MTKISFKKSKFKAFFIFLLTIAIASVGMAIGLYFYFGQATAGEDLTEGLSDKLSYGGSFTLEDVLEEEQYNYTWIKSNNVDVEVYAINDKDESVLTKEVLVYSNQDRTFKVVGVSKGIIKFISKVDKTVNFSVPFTTKFKSVDTNGILTESYPLIAEDEVFTSSELQDVQLVRVEKRASVDLNDFKLLEGLEKVIIKDTPEGKLISVKNFELPSSATIYVEDNQYLEYVNSENQTWQSYANRIYPIVVDTASHSVVLYKNGGVFEDDNGKLIANFEVEDGGSVSLSTEYAISRVGYQFLGWYSSNGDVVNPSDLVSDSFEFKSDIKLYAKWQANSYTVRLHHNDGTDEYTEKQFTYDSESAICDDTPSYSGFVQIGWASSADSSKVVYDNKQIVKNLTTTNNGVIELYATWVYQAFSLQFYSWNTQKEYVEYGSSKQHVYGDNVTLSLALGAPESGYGSFLGWALKPDASKEEFKYNDVLRFDSIKELLTSKTDGILRIYPVFRLESYDLSYDANGGSPTPVGESGIPCGVQIYLSKQIEREGYKFKGWVDNAGYIWISEALYQKDKEYYDTVYTNKVEILVENEYGYSAPEGMKHIPQSNAKVVLTADWVANTFNVVFTGDQTDSSYYNPAVATYGEEASFKGEISKTGHSKSSCISDYGSVSLEGKVLSIEQIATIYRALRGSTSDNDFDCSKTVTFNVSWTPNTYRVEFNYNSGYGSTSYIDVVYGTAYGALPSASRSNRQDCDTSNHCYTYYNFSYWKDSSGRKITSSTILDTPKDHTLTAVWSSGNVTKDHCIASGTLVKLPDGTRKKVEDLVVGDEILAWDFKTQKFVATPVTLLVNHGEGNCNILTLSFESGEAVRIIGDHVFFDATIKEYVTINSDNYTDYLGHEFLAYDTDEAYSLTRLVAGNISNEKVGSYAIVTAYYFNAVTENIVTCTPNIPIYELISSYVKDDLTFDVEQFEMDVEKYGLYEYSLFEEYLTYEQFVQLCAPYFSLAEAKGFTTYEEVYKLMVMYSYIY